MQPPGAPCWEEPTPGAQLCCNLELRLSFEQGVPPFHFPMSPTNYAAGPIHLGVQYKRNHFIFTVSANRLMGIKIYVNLP